VQDVLEQASGATKNQFTRTRLLRPIGMQGFWLNYVFYGKARDMARFGHLVLSNGVWDGDTIMGDTAYMKAMSTPSQGINESYGLLWWLNGQASYMLPRQQFQLSGEMMPPAPSDMFAALGKNDQKIYVIPSLDMVVVRQGNSAGNIALAGSSFDSELWEKINGLSCGATSLEDDFMEEKISLYPQPAQDELWVDMPEAMSGPSFHLYSLEGKRIQSLSSSQVGNTFRLQIGEIPAGFYILEIHSEGHFLRKKISIH
jgi:CubicO group peptidase (beta-lactamase class C family)